VKRIYARFISKQQTLMFQYINYLLDCKEKDTPKKKRKRMRVVMEVIVPLPQDIN
jgi:hypothetical protein